MSLASGTRLGPYEITAQIGAGGMGEVYRATDRNLGRQVAIKVLPDAIAQDPERVARFEREARTLATLNHPNIAIVHGFEKSDGLRALVMELVEGPTLADRIAQGPIPLDEALPIAKQIAEALEAAHEHGIIHRDLKPANIKLRPDGTVKVLDFGLAKALAPEPGSAAAVDLSQSPTITSPAMMSGVGMILGTAAYMAPEQAKGRAADKRSDVWAFGAVLYEMLSGVRAFQGDDVSDTLAAVLRSEPTWAALPASTPPLIRRLLRRCLEKDRKRRLDSVADARLEIDDALTAPLAVDGAAVSAGLPSRRLVIAVSLGLFVGAAIAALATWVATRPTPITSPDLVRFTITPPQAQMLDMNSPDRDVAVAPDGRHLVYQEGNIGTLRSFVRPIGQFAAVPLRGPADMRWPFISPDSHWIGFFGQGELRKVPMTGEQPITLCRFPGLAVRRKLEPRQHDCLRHHRQGHRLAECAGRRRRAEDAYTARSRSE